VASNEPASGGDLASALRTHSEVRFERRVILRRQRVAEIRRYFFAGWVFAQIVTVEGVCHVEPDPL
jgi:hypothetical protein